MNLNGVLLAWEKSIPYARRVNPHYELIHGDDFQPGDVFVRF